MGFPGGSDGIESACNAGNLGSVPRLGRSPEEGNGYSLVFLPGEFHGQRSLVGYSLWDHKESDRTERLILSLSFHLDTLCPEEEGPSFFPNVSSLGMRTPFPEIPSRSPSCFIVYVRLNSHS